MAEMYGNFEVDFDSGVVRMKTGSSDYEYIVSEKMFGGNVTAAKTAARIFQQGYLAGEMQMKRQLRSLMS
jgi:hypothetical protein